MSVTASKFKKEYKRYLNNEITYKELCSTFGITRSTMYCWIDKFKLSARKIKARPNAVKKEPPSNLKNIYKKYLNDEFTYSELLKELRIGAGVMNRWTAELGLPPKEINRAHNFKDVPENFEKLWYDFLESKITLDELCKTLKARNKIVYKWARRLKLPQKSDIWFNCKIFNRNIIIKKPFKFKKVKSVNPLKDFQEHSEF